MKNITTVGVVGAGTMGSALAQKFAQENFQVILADRDISFVERGIQNISHMLNEGKSILVFTEEQVNAYLSNIKGTANLNDLSACDLIVEAIYENFEAKMELFRQLDRIAQPDAIIATNTSSFSVSELSTAFRDPKRFIGLHYFYHAAKNRLVEIIPGAQTSEETQEIARAFSMQSGKDAISCKDSYGFVVNRYFVPWLNESVRLLDTGVANIPTIDAVCMQTFGIGMGPFALMNATGVPVAYHSQKTLEVFGKFYQVSERLRQQTDLGQPWNLDGEISNDTAVRKEISERMLGVEFLVCSQLLDEKVCAATDINRGARIGLRWRKGPIELMQQMGEGEVKRLIQQIVEFYKIDMPNAVGPGFWEMQFVELRITQDRAILSINRPEDLNALNETIMRQLDEQFSLADADPQVNTIFLMGSGKAFVAGADIKFFIKNIHAENMEAIERFTAYGQSVFSKIDQSRKQVVAILNGLALGGGLELALCADIIYALPKSMLSFPETGIGIYPGLGGTQRSALKTDKGISKYLIETGKMVNAREALEIGLVDAVIPIAQMFDLLSGKIKAAHAPKKPPMAKWKNLSDFFLNHSLDDILTGNYSGNGISHEEADTISKTLKRKAPVALRIADKLIGESKGCASELEHLSEIFSTQDALLGLSSIGKKIVYEGK